jgi:hypothetical protein
MAFLVLLRLDEGGQELMVAFYAAVTKQQGGSEHPVRDVTGLVRRA